MAFTIPVSMTYLIPEIVTDVSAILVARMTFLQPCAVTSGNIKRYNTHGQFSASANFLCVGGLLYLGCWLEDPELLCWRQRRVQRDDYHGAAAIGKMLGDVSARPC